MEVRRAKGRAAEGRRAKGRAVEVKRAKGRRQRRCIQQEVQSTALCDACRSMCCDCAVITAKTTFGNIACVHLSPIQHNPHLLCAHCRIMDENAIIMGDMNSTWHQMTGGSAQSGSVQDETHESAHMPSYLPGIESSDKARAAPAFDHIVVRHGRLRSEHRPVLSVKLAVKQFAKLQLIKNNPRKVQLDHVTHLLVHAIPSMTCTLRCSTHARTSARIM